MTTTKNNKTKLTMKKLAYHVLKVAKENKLPHTRLNLFLTMYFSLKKAKDDSLIPIEILKSMYDESFELWPINPIVYSLYRRYMVAGQNDKNIVERGARRVVELDVLNPVIIKLLSTDVYELSERYTQQPFYLNNRRTIGRAIGDVTIKLEDI